MCYTGCLDDSDTFQFGRRDRQVIEEPNAFSQ